MSTYIRFSGVSLPSCLLAVASPFCHFHSPIVPCLSFPVVSWPPFRMSLGIVFFDGPLFFSSCVTQIVILVSLSPLFIHFPLSSYLYPLILLVFLRLYALGPPSHVNAEITCSARASVNKSKSAQKRLMESLTSVRVGVPATSFPLITAAYY